MHSTLSRRLASEAVGTALLLAAVIGSAVMADRLCGGNAGLALLANALATGGALVALIVTFGPISGAHLNPVVSLAAASQGELSWGEAWAFVGAQQLGAVAGVALAHLMFGAPLVAPSTHERSGAGVFVGELVATFTLLLVVRGVTRRPTPWAPAAVAATIVAGYWFTASTSFANPAASVARALSDTVAGIRPLDVPGFVGAELLGALAATLFFRWLSPPAPDGPPTP
ncbi:MAG: aquaporin family protein [Myxococcaceae bacterium]|nr:aquaporin family protein [Myxococcaceae bacterium]